MTNTGSRRDDQERKKMKILPETVLEHIGIDDFRIEKDAVYLSPAHLRKVADNFGYTLYSGCIGFEKYGIWWMEEAR